MYVGEQLVTGAAAASRRDKAAPPRTTSSRSSGGRSFNSDIAGPISARSHSRCSTIFVSRCSVLGTRVKYSPAFCIPEARHCNSIRGPRRAPARWGVTRNSHSSRTHRKSLKTRIGDMLYPERPGASDFSVFFRPSVRRGQQLRLSATRKSRIGVCGAVAMSETTEARRLISRLTVDAARSR
jgi:hypothetical protein